MPLIARVGAMPCRSSAAFRRQKPTRMPYSCQAQLGRSGVTAAPCGADSTWRGMVRSMSHRSMFTTRKTATRLPPGQGQPGAVDGGLVVEALEGSEGFGHARMMTGGGVWFKRIGAAGAPDEPRSRRPGANAARLPALPRRGALLVVGRTVGRGVLARMAHAIRIVVPIHVNGSMRTAGTRSCPWKHARHWTRSYHWLHSARWNCLRH